MSPPSHSKTSGVSSLQLAPPVQVGVSVKSHGATGPACLITSPVPEVSLPSSRCTADARGCEQPWGMVGIAENALECPVW